MSDAREREFALREAAVNDAEERYFKARPIDDGAMQRKAFRAGFDRAWDAKERELAEARAECERLREVAKKFLVFLEASIYSIQRPSGQPEISRLLADLLSAAKCHAAAIDAARKS